MAKYSKAHERDEVSKMWRGFWHSTFGILLCWVPGLGLILSISGFARQVVRLTARHRVRMALLIIYGLISLSLSLGVIFGGLYYYSRDNQFFLKKATEAWHALTGQDALPGQTPPNDYTDNPNPGLGVFTDGSDDPIGSEEDAQEEEPDIQIGSVADLLSGKVGTLPAVGDETQDLPDDEIGEGDVDLDPDAEDDDGDILDLDDIDPMMADDYMELDFYYVVEDDKVSAEGEYVRVEYKIVIDKETPTDDDLMRLYEDAIYEDGYDLHTLLIYRDESELSGNFTVAQLTQPTPEAKPTLTRP